MIKIVKRNFIIWVIFMFKGKYENIENKSLKNSKKTNRTKEKFLYRKSIKVSLIVTFIILLLTTFIFIYFTNNSEVEALSKYGSRGDEVRQIQEKLKRWGYYNGNVDGIFGSQTQEAVR